MTRSLLPVALVLVLAANRGSLAAEATAAFQVIVHPDADVTILTRSELADIFLRSRVAWDDGTRIHPVDHPMRSALRSHFLRATYGKSGRFMTRYWHRRIFSGRALPPPELASEDDVIAYVRGIRGAIGYIGPGPVPAGVRVVELRF